MSGVTPAPVASITVPFAPRIKTTVLYWLGSPIQLALIAGLIALVAYTVPVEFDKNGALVGVQITYWVGFVGIYSLAILAGGLVLSHYKVKKTGHVKRWIVAAIVAVVATFCGLLTIIGLQLGDPVFNVGNLFLGALLALVLGANVGWVAVMTMLSRLPEK